MIKKFSLLRYYMRLHIGLRERCDLLSLRQRKWIVYGLSGLYLVCSGAMIVQAFLPHGQKEVQTAPARLTDNPIKTDTLHTSFQPIYSSLNQ